jgi:hypothetical protein
MKRLAALIFISTTLFGQPEKKKLTFEVVSIKPNNSGSADWEVDSQHLMSISGS